MHILADLHVHTIASGHAYSTVQECVTTAAAKGLELVAFLDHGPTLSGGADKFHFGNLKALPSILDGVRIIKGIEANVVDADGMLDLDERRLKMLDLVAVGLHTGLGFDEGDVAHNTRTIVRAIANPLVDLVTHPGNIQHAVDIDAIVDAAAEYGVALELNDHSFSVTGARAGSAEREIEVAMKAKAAGVKIAIGSDAHFHRRVGCFERALAAASQAGLTEDDILNADAASVVRWLTERRERPYMDTGGVW